MNMLISLATNFGGWILGGLGAVIALWFGVHKIKGDERDKIAGESARAELAVAKQGAEVRRIVDALAPADRRKLRVKFTRPDDGRDL
jgi:hypothetical protein